MNRLMDKHSRQNVEVGKLYIIKHSGQLTRVRLLSIEKKDQLAGRDRFGLKYRSVTRYIVLKLATKRTLELKSSAKFLYEVVNEFKPWTADKVRATLAQHPDRLTLQETEIKAVVGYMNSDRICAKYDVLGSWERMAIEVLTKKEKDDATSNQ